MGLLPWCSAAHGIAELHGSNVLRSFRPPEGILVLKGVLEGYICMYVYM